MVQRTEDDKSQNEYSMTGRSGGRVTSCVVCTVHKEMGNTDLLVEPQNQGHRGFRFRHQNRQLRFSDLCLKITATVSWFESQN
jgi:hypothetical protein